ncbi:MAG: hypothetical protein O3C40_11505 [Planctomycetota bacterium]|nr:hypothetical protein [Planctomycetota bacterium]
MFFEPLEARRVLATDFASIAGTVFSDQTDDGFTGDDLPVVAANMHLYLDGSNGTFESAGGVAGGDDTFIGTDPTDASGQYRFDGIVAGTYFVEEETPAGFIIRPGENVSTVLVSLADADGTVGLSVDDFTTTDQTATADVGTPVASDAAAATVLGGERDLLATYLSGPFDVELMASTMTSSLIIDSGTATTGNFNVTWDGIDGDATTLAATGLGNQDLTNLGVADRMQFLIRADLAGALVTVNVYTSAADFSSFTTTIPAGPLTEFLVPFSSFTPTGSGANFALVGAIEMVVNGVAELNAELTLVGSIGRTVLPANFANFEPLTLGNLVFKDVNNDGVFNSATESGITDVAVSLYSDTDADGAFTPGTDTLVATATTNGSGVYQFTDLFPGEYIVQLDESNFDPGNALEGLKSSTGNAPTPDPDDDVNNDDNGDTLAGEGIVSAAITLSPNSESITDGDTNPDTNQTLDFGVFEELDLSVTKTVDIASPNVGDNVTFTVTVANAGPGNGTNITVRDVLPAGLTYISDTPSFGTYDSGTGVWTVGSLASGDSETLVISASVDSVGIKSNTAEVTAVDQPDIDSTPNNNIEAEDDQETADVTPLEADVSLTKTVSDAAPNVGDSVTFTITASNAGPNDATNVTVGDLLPAGTTYVSDTPSRERMMTQPVSGRLEPSRAGPV